MTKILKIMTKITSFFFFFGPFPFVLSPPVNCVINFSVEKSKKEEAVMDSVMLLGILFYLLFIYKST